MKSDFQLLVKHFPANDDIKVYPVSDLHIGSSEFMFKKWDEFKRRIMDEPNSYMTIGGDMMNNATRGSVGCGVFEDTMRPADQKKWLASELYALRDKILCVVPGNHEGRSAKDVDDNPLYDVCCKLDIEDRYRENMAFVKVQIGKKAGNGLQNPTYVIGVTHGAGGGTLTGSSVNRNEKAGMMIDGLDALVVGHSHKGAFTKPQKLYIDKANNKVSFKQFVVVSSTSWLNYGGYALKGMMNPASNDLQTIVLKGNEKKIELIW